MNRRIAVALHWVLGRRNDVSTRELLSFLGSPTCRSKARRLIQRLDCDAQTCQVHVKGIPIPLVWPKTVDLVWLYMTLSEQAYADDWHFYEVPETTVERGDVVADCGAAEGLFSLRAAERASRVFAIEPLPLWCECMRETFAHSTNVEVLPHALAAESGRARLQGSGFTARLSVYGDTDVSIETIDNLFFRRGIPLSYLKADLEGHDFAMLLGARETIRTFAPKIAITTYHRPDHARTMMEYLKALNDQYRFRTKGIEAQAGAPVMLHAWVDK